MNAFFFGAGSSCGTLLGSSVCPPVGADFGRALVAADLNWEQHYGGIAKVVRHLGRPMSELSLEEIWTCIDYYAKLGHALPQPASWLNASRDLATLDLKRALLRLYGRGCDLTAETLPLSEDYTLGYLMKNRMQPGDLVISFNYDTIVERLAQRFGHRLLSVGTKPRRDVVEIVKPHGSTSWTLDFKLKRVVSAPPGAEPLLDSVSEEEVLNGKEPLVLGAVPIKSELIREVQVCWLSEVFDAVMRQWSAVVAAVRDAEVFVVVGYSFPREDHYGRFLLREGVCLRSTPVKVEYYELADRAAVRAASIIEAFPGDGIQIEWKGDVRPP
jgi:hypothetical protein